ncbi:tail fiber domain-containing protein [Bizionia myxarmorum]|uniref:Peptidase S74 domain-containing protein n=1 Tax=Bizionia myxarmorum TaxID=291186 RepID=A0A5D0R4P3_9FLAO|nr:tail fiber domain-containing protein [Bizionia myxarmorum]TYB76452.1 hypothetical protein ES674_12795 [Bizionia myxarmorum]
MKVLKHIILGLILLISYTAIAQNGINYKAIIKDANGNIIANDLISVQFTILQGVAQTNVYQEIRTPTTDANGIIIINIGEGTPVSGTFNAIDWASDTTFLNTKINTGAGLVDMGTTEFKTVPYALHAETAAVANNVSGLEIINEGNGNGWRLKGRDPSNYANIGLYAVDISTSLVPSTTAGATGNYATAIGYATKASNLYTTAMGVFSEASANSSTAMGRSTVASGSNSTAMGYGTEAFGSNSSTLGSGTFASGTNSVATGDDTEATGDNSISMGLSTKASGLNSTALGYNTKASSYNSLAIGKYNVGGGSATTWVETDPIFEIGYGSYIGFPVNGILRLNSFTILKNGHVGIGTSTPSSRFQIAVGDDASYNSDSGYLVLGATNGSNLVFDENEIMARNNGAASTLFLQQDGGDVRVGGVVVHSSDRRLKKDITPLSYGLETILQLNPVAYHWNNRTQDHKSIGLIAQEVQPIIKEIVHTADNEDRTLSLSYTELIPVLINAVKELKSENNSLKARIEALENN